jgi:hypothetical protein
MNESQGVRSAAPQSQRERSKVTNYLCINRMKIMIHSGVVAYEVHDEELHTSHSSVSLVPTRLTHTT